MWEEQHVSTKGSVSDNEIRNKKAEGLMAQLSAG